MYQCVIVDDEPHAIEGLKKYLSNFDRLYLSASFTNPLAALKYFESVDCVDLVLLDIDMPNINGIELSRMLRNKTKKIVFTTAHTKYGYEAFKIEADDYLLKPFTLGEFLTSMNKVFSSNGRKCNSYDKNASFLVKSKEDRYKMLNIKFSDVVAVESKMNYVMIHTLKRKILTYMTLSEVSDIFKCQPGFLRFQRSFILAEEHIEYISGNSIKMVNGCEMTVGDYYKKDFLSFVSEKLIKTKRR
ncbi:LytR/AlgR family response regulator transcription factor [Pedobacter sp. KBS0701]|uniref:LytR/AlgR family response regulator transcription factor n=1 Tax=unclassified Pedobacter TaxID=2628915 RepID=UPI00110D48E7|nr:LytTR family DNA-binding domain-containing protein [Pedobacter sp. KBS0701]QDW24858.1 response regulator transcription factor [Pedobacter sp. KBS0701]